MEPPGQLGTPALISRKRKSKPGDGPPLARVPEPRGASTFVLSRTILASSLAQLPGECRAAMWVKCFRSPWPELAPQAVLQSFPQEEGRGLLCCCPDDLVHTAHPHLASPIPSWWPSFWQWNSDSVQYWGWGGWVCSSGGVVDYYGSWWWQKRTNSKVISLLWLNPLHITHPIFSLPTMVYQCSRVSWIIKGLWICLFCLKIQYPQRSTYFVDTSVSLRAPSWKTRT